MTRTIARIKKSGSVSADTPLAVAFKKLNLHHTKSPIVLGIITKKTQLNKLKKNKQLHRLAGCYTKVERALGVSVATTGFESPPYCPINEPSSLNLPMSPSSYSTRLSSLPLPPPPTPPFSAADADVGGGFVYCGSSLQG